RGHTHFSKTTPCTVKRVATVHDSPCGPNLAHGGVQTRTRTNWQLLASSLYGALATSVAVAPITLRRVFSKWKARLATYRTMRPRGAKDIPSKEMMAAIATPKSAV